MFWFILGIISAIAGIVLVIGAKAFAGEGKSPASFRVLGVVLIVLFLPLFAISGLKSVPVKNIGVPQSFGAVHSGFYNPGIHETWEPWLHLTDVDETVQTTTFETGSQPNQQPCQGGLAVRIGGQQAACADVTIQWQVLPAAAGSLFSDYANSTTVDPVTGQPISGNLMKVITDAVVIRELKSEVNDQIGDYNPITDVQSVAGTNNATSQFTQFGPQILTAMQGKIGTRIHVLNVLIPYIHYSSTVEEKLAAIQQAYANFAIAQENVKVNHQQALAYAQLGQPTVAQLISECLTSTVPRPVGFQCFPGSASGLSISGK
jgi:regulator of protease activity HflC (stomatin/prohibitin superfamily)